MTDEKVLTPDEPSETDVAPPSEADTYEVEGDEPEPEPPPEPDEGEA